MTTAADRVIAHNAGRHRRDADPWCSLCPDVLPIDDVKHPYIFNPAPRDHVVIHGRLNYVGDVSYTYRPVWPLPASRFALIAIGIIGDEEIGTAFTRDAAIKAQTFMKRA